MNEYTKGEQCSTKVSGSGGWYSYQCQKKPTVTRNGKSYCKIHDPEYIKEKDRLSREKWDKEGIEIQKKADRHQAIAIVCEGLDTETLNKLTPSLLRAAPKLLEALESVLWDLEQRAMPNDLNFIRQAIAEAKEVK